MVVEQGGMKLHHNRIGGINNVYALHKFQHYIFYVNHMALMYLVRTP
jgi:hypothetical protein